MTLNTLHCGHVVVVCLLHLRQFYDASGAVPAYDGDVLALEGGDHVKTDVLKGVAADATKEGTEDQMSVKRYQRKKDITSS